jgi:hypothetical protein
MNKVRGSGSGDGRTRRAELLSPWAYQYGISIARMELHDPITLGDELQFCETGNRLALVFLNTSRDVVKQVYTESATDCHARVESALAALHWHVANCADCTED